MASLKSGNNRKYEQSPDWQFRLATANNRVLPEALVIGAQKSGTSSMHYCIGQHPQLVPPIIKEVHYFDGGLLPDVDSFERGASWYRAHFPLEKEVSVNQKAFESSPLYIFNPLVPKRIIDLVPDAKIIALLRNPTERAISHYFHTRRKNNDPLSIHEAMVREETRLQEVIDRQDYKSHEFIHFSYKARGLYKEQLERYFELFSRDQILVMASEEFFAKPDSCLMRVFGFLGVDDRFKVSNLTPQNLGRNRSYVSAEIYEYLNDYFLPHNKDLYDLIGEDFGW